MKNYLKALILTFSCSVVIAIIIYLGTAFAEYNLNPAHWQSFSRGFAAFFGAIFICYLFLLLLHFKMN